MTSIESLSKNNCAFNRAVMSAGSSHNTTSRNDTSFCCQSHLTSNHSFMHGSFFDNSSGTPLLSAVKQPTHMVVVLVVAYSIIFVAALVGNTMVVAVVMMRPGMRSVTNLFIANLAVADMLVAVLCIPTTLLDNIYYGWPFGAVLCKLVPYIQGVSVCASVYNLAAIAVDRYVAICFKPQLRIMRRGACLTLAGIWIFSFALMTPWLAYYQHFKEDRESHSLEYCLPNWPNVQAQKAYFIIAIFLGTYLLPLIVVFLCYILIARKVWQRRAPGVTIGYNIIKRYKMKVIKMLVTVVTVFALSWLPLHLIYLLGFFDLSTDKHVTNQIANIGIPVAQWLELSNSGMNAFIYCFFSENFRRGFIDIYRCVCRRQMANKRADSFSMHAARRPVRSMSEGSSMMTNCNIRSQTARWQDSRRTCLEKCTAEKKRFVWKDRCSDVSAARVSNSGNVSAVHKWPRVRELSHLERFNSRQSSNVVNNPMDAFT